MIYTAPWLILLNLEFFGPQRALAYRLDAISKDPKNSRFPGTNPIPLALVMDAARIKSIMHGAVQIIVAYIVNFLSACSLCTAKYVLAAYSETTSRKEAALNYLSWNLTTKSGKFKLFLCILTKGMGNKIISGYCFFTWTTYWTVVYTEELAPLLHIHSKTSDPT